MAHRTFSIRVLGSGDWNGSATRHAPSFLLKTKDIRILMDCGPGSLHRLSQLHIKPDQLDEVWITHFHPDHMSDLVPLLVQRTLLERASKLQKIIKVRGPRGLYSRLNELFHIFCVSQLLTDFIEIIEYDEQCSFSIHHLKVQPFRVSHIPQEVCLGYRIERKGKVFVYMGDAGGSFESQPAGFEKSVQSADMLLFAAGAERSTQAHIDIPEAVSWVERLQVGTAYLYHINSDRLSKAQEELKSVASSVPLRITNDGDLLSL